MPTSIETLITAKIYEAVSKKSTMTVELPRSELPTDLTTVHEVGFERDGEEEIWRGYAVNITSAIDEDGTEIATLVAEGREVELEWGSSYRGVRLRNLTPQAALNEVLLGTGWTGTVVGTGFPTPITFNWDNKSRLDCLFDLAKILQGFITFNRLARTLTIRNTSAASGIMLRDTRSIIPPASFGLVKSIDLIEDDRSTLANRIIGEAKNDQGDLLTLQKSNKSSPYSRNFVVIGRPQLTGANYMLGVTGTPENPDEAITQMRNYTLESPEEIVQGENRLVLIFSAILHIDTSKPKFWGPIMVNGQAAKLLTTELVIYTGGRAVYLRIYYVVNPSKGKVSVSGQAMNYLGYTMAAAFSDVDIISPFASTTSVESTVGSPIAINRTIPDINHVMISACYAQWEADAAFANLNRSVNSISNGTRLLPLNSDVGQSQNQMVLTGYDTCWMSWTQGISGSRTHTYTFDVNAFNDEAAAVATVIKPARNYYVNDVTSEGKYGSRIFPLSLGNLDISELADTNVQRAAANTLYDYSVDYLIQNKDPKINYGVEASWIPTPVKNWDVGQTLDIDTDKLTATLAIPERTAIYRSEGYREWQLVLNTRNRFRESFYDMLEDYRRRINMAQFQQV